MASRMYRRNSGAVEPSKALWSYQKPRMPVWQMAMASPTATGRLVGPSVHYMATWGWLIIGADA
jgi:hypothetical protein